MRRTARRFIRICTRACERLRLASSAARGLGTKSIGIPLDEAGQRRAAVEAAIERLRGSATVAMTTDEIMALTR